MVDSKDKELVELNQLIVKQSIEEERAKERLRKASQRKDFLQKKQINVVTKKIEQIGFTFQNVPVLLGAVMYVKEKLDKQEITENDLENLFNATGADGR